MVTDGQKRLYERLVRFAGTDGRCFPSQSTLANALGKSERQIRKDLVKLEQFRLIRHLWRDGRRNNTYEFLWHRIFDERYCSAGQPKEAVEAERNSGHFERNSTPR
jgi:Helix-turn-helix domain